jgi:hypothetical protein
MDAYRLGLRGKVAQFAVKKYKSHLRVPASILEEIGSFHEAHSAML